MTRLFQSQCDAPPRSFIRLACFLVTLLLPLATITSGQGKTPGESNKPSSSRLSSRVKLDFDLYLEGRYVYERNCIDCHGPRGDGQGELGVKLHPRPRSFRKGLFKFRSTPPGTLPTEADLVRTIRGGLSGTDMGMFTNIRDNDLRAVIEYIKYFSPRWRRAENYAEPLAFPPPPEWLEQTTQREEHAIVGGQLFQEFCASCHGPDADGDGIALADIIDEWGKPVRASDLRQPYLRCGPNPADIYRVLATGLDGSLMVSFEDTLAPEQRWDIIAYLSTLKLPEQRTLGAAPASSLILKD
ncbi:cytochrome c [Opitutaceae bacterium]|nr:cytochrome c [bacterium]MDB4384508.1 cytochrome c [Opitutaceae bacterium]MDB4473667.1 cytochrome c [Opitutaceae bacterium]